MIADKKEKKQEIFAKILDKVEKMGYNKHVGMLPIFLCGGKKTGHNTEEKELKKLSNKILYSQKEKIVYSHEFARAFWGEGNLEDRELGRYPEWLWHLQVMVSTGDPISYLEEFLGNEE